MSKNPHYFVAYKGRKIDGGFSEGSCIVNISLPQYSTWEQRYHMLCSDIYENFMDKDLVLSEEDIILTALTPLD